MDNLNLQSIIENCGFSCRSYSGRGMYGKNCLGVECNNTMSLFADLLDSVADFENMAYAVETIAGAIRQAKQDNMGLNIIVYFPNEEYTETKDGSVWD